MAVSFLGVLTRIAFFIASFFPLWGIMIFLAVFEYGLESFLYVYLAIILVVVICISHVRIQFRKSKNEAENPKILIIKSRKETTKEYVFSVMPYVLVLASADMQIEKIIALLAIFLIIGILYVRTNMVLTNPMLLLLGFRIFEITYEEQHKIGYEKTTLFVARNPPWNGATITVEEIYDGIHMESK